MNTIRLVLVFFVVQLHAQGGMWVPSLLNGRNEAEMKKLGMKISVEDIYQANQPGIKDAVPQFNGGCTAEVISSKGLLLTNHHCGYEQIQSHSTLANDYLTNGFWAMSMQEELPNPGSFVTFVVRIDDVTKQVMEGVAEQGSEKDKQTKIQQNIAELSSTLTKESWQENSIRSFFDGNQYLLFVTETFKDIRLVGAPPSAIGKFGSDTDNWVWPRHTGDFALFRIYADKQNRPAVYAADNVPYVPKHFLPVSIAGVNENDFTMVIGYPGRTNEYLPAVAVSQILNELDPAKIAVRDAALKVQDGYMRKDPQIKIQYAAKYASVANYWKKWIGEVQGLKKSNAVGVKKTEEALFKNKVKAAGRASDYGSLLDDFEQAYTEIAPYALARDYFQEVFLRNTELTTAAYRLYQLEQIFKTKGEQSFNDRKNNLINGMGEFYKDFNAVVDRDVFRQLIAIYINKMPVQFLPPVLQNADFDLLTQKVYSQSRLGTFEGFNTLLTGDSKTIIDNLNADAGYQLIKLIADDYQAKVQPKYEALSMRINGLQRTYMRAILELNPTGRIFPDANSTLRVTYGKVKGYQPADAISYGAHTYLDGVLEKYIPGDYEFDVPQKLIDLYNKKAYGRYAHQGKMPVCFIATNHTTGGNSGSPALDANGNLIGLNFDRVWEGTMSDIYYDPAICRNIMVDIRYVLFIIEKYAEAKHLINELKIVSKP